MEKGLLDEIAGPDVTIIDPAPAVARQTRNVLQQRDQLAPETQAGSLRCYTTGDARRMHQQLEATSAPENLSLRIVELAEHNEAAWRAEFPRAVTWLFGLKPVE